MARQYQQDPHDDHIDNDDDYGVSAVDGLDSEDITIGSLWKGYSVFRAHLEQTEIINRQTEFWQK